MSSYPTPCYADMQRAVPSDPRAGTNTYLVMPSYTAISNFSIFEGLGRTDLFPDFGGDVLYDVAPTHVGKFRLSHSGYSSVSQLICEFNIAFSTFADFRQLQIPNAQTKYYEIVPAHTKTPQNTTLKIANLYFEFKFHYFEQGCTLCARSRRLISNTN